MVDRSVDGRRTGEVQWMSFVVVVVGDVNGGQG